MTAASRPRRRTPAARGRTAAPDRQKFTTIAHRDLALLNPLDSGRVDRVLALLELPPGARVLDVGCGKAEMLMRLIEQYGCSGVGVDTNPAFLAEARARAYDRGVADRLELVERPAADLGAPDHSFDAVLCVGATHAFGGYRRALEAMRRLARPGGLVLVGEGYWRRKPAPAYLKAIGAKAGEYTDHAGNVALGIAAGLTWLYALASSAGDFDHYEGLYNRAVESWCREHPSDLDVEAIRSRIHAWRGAYLRWGRETLGFALYLFRAG